MGHLSAGNIQRPGVERVKVKSRGVLCAVCVMKGGYEAGSPSLCGGNDVPGRRTSVGITSETEAQEMRGISSETAHAKQEGGQYRAYGVRTRVVHEKKGRWTEGRTKKGRAIVRGKMKSVSKRKIYIFLVRWRCQMNSFPPNYQDNLCSIASYLLV